MVKEKKPMGWKSWNEVQVAPVDKAEYKHSVEAIYAHQGTGQVERGFTKIPVLLISFILKEYE